VNEVKIKMISTILSGVILMAAIFPSFSSVHAMNPDNGIQEDLLYLSEELILNGNDATNVVSSRLDLPKTIGTTTTVEWTSSLPDVINADGFAIGSNAFTFEPVQAQKVRLFVAMAEGDIPSICEFEVYNTKEAQPVKYTVSFNSNGGSVVDSITAIPKNTSITLPSPTRDGYVFLGWYTDNNTFAHEFTNRTRINANTALYAKWIDTASVRHTVTFEVNGGSAGNPITGILHGETMPMLPTSTLLGGFVFEGWFLDDNTFEHEFTTETAVTANVTVYAKFALRSTPEVNKALLDANIEFAQKLNVDQYLETGKAELLDALANAEEVSENPSALLEEIDLANHNLKYALYRMRMIPSKDKLEELISN
jgi:uncharacterized repeat protein (TIGR02543 family)